MKSIPVVLINANRVGTTKQVRMRVDSKVEINSDEFGKLDSMVGNIGVLVVGDDIVDTPSDAYIQEELSKVKVDKPIQGKSHARLLRDAVWRAQLNLMDGERPDSKYADEVYKRFMSAMTGNIDTNPELIRKYL